MHPFSPVGRVIVAALSAVATLSTSTAGSIVHVNRPRHAVDARAWHHLFGADISWPQCHRGRLPKHRGKGQPMPFRSARFVVVGLTKGPAYRPNPCLARQVRWAKQHHLYAAAYAVATYPHPAQLRRHGARGPHRHRTLAGRLWNAGYAEARYNVVTMRRVGLRSPVVWMDVEPGRISGWKRHRARNAAVLRGVVASYRHYGYKVGVYSTRLLWRSIAGRLRLGLPEWRTAGPTRRRAALHHCSRSPIQGGHAVLAQWWGPHRDFDVLCGRPTPGRRNAWFTKY